MTTGQPPKSKALRTRVLIKIASTAVVGAFTFLVSNATSQALTNSLLMSIVIGGIVLLTQFLIDFESRLDALEKAQHESLKALAAEQQGRLTALAASQQERFDELRETQARNLEEARNLIARGFARVGDATKLFQKIEGSMLGVDDVAKLALSSSKIKNDSQPIVRDLAKHVIARFAEFLDNLSTGKEFIYDGEDREWLLGLTASVQKSIDATSLTTMDAGRRGFDGGLWTSDLGNRYLDLQREAIARRGVRVRRIFVFDRPAFAEDPDFQSILRMQQQAGIQVRMLDENTIPDQLRKMVRDFIVFDQMITYDMRPEAYLPTTGKPSLLTTHLCPVPARVQELADRFERLWQSASAGGPQ